MSKVRKKIKKTYFQDNIFCMHYYFTTSKKVYNWFMDYFKLEKENLNGINGRCLLATAHGEHIIFIGYFNGGLDVLCHEVTHAALFTLEQVGQELSYNDELLAYLNGYIFRECQKRIK